MNETQRALVAAHGIARIEFDILDTVHLHCDLARTHVAEYAVFFDSPNLEPSFTLAEYEAATETCIKKGWLKVLTAEDCEQDRLRWQNDPNPYGDEIEYKADNVDFTEEGARLFYSVLVAMDTAEGKRPYHDRIRYAWNVSGQVGVFGAYEDEVKQSAEDAVTGENWLGGEVQRIERAAGPFPIGPWWLNRFVQLPQGYRADIYYTAFAGNSEADVT